MKKKYYIQPSFEFTELITDHMMLPGSPTSGSYDAQQGGGAPMRRVPVMGNDTVPVF